MPLTPCPACLRHVRAEDLRCPFCGAEPERRSAGGAWPLDRLSRAAVFAFGVSVTAACGDSTSSDDDAGLVEDGGDPGVDANITPPYGTPPQDAGGDEDAGVADDAGTQPDAGADAGAEPDASIAPDAGHDAGGVAPPYGLPPVDGGGAGPLYGGPPEG